MRVGALLREPMKLQGVGTRRQQDKVVSDLLGEVGLPANAVERFPTSSPAANASASAWPGH